MSPSDSVEFQIDLLHFRLERVRTRAHALRELHQAQDPISRLRRRLDGVKHEWAALMRSMNPL